MRSDAPPSSLAEMEGDAAAYWSETTPARVSMPCISTPYSRRLSSSFFPVMSPPVPRTIAWFSLQGRLVGAEEATSAGVIGGGLSGREEAVAWELFSPLQRVLLVAVVAAASNRSRRIAQLQRSVQIRDEVLLSMQQKLDDLCDQMTFFPDQVVKNNSGIVVSKVAHDASQFCCSRKPLQELNHENGTVPLCKDTSNEDITEVEKEDIFNINNTVIVEQEERRMSDLSDFNWSVASSVDLQLSTLASEQEFYNLRKECEEKDVMIKELTSATNAIKAADTKRITELEEIIRRKNMVISKLKKDMVVLEKQVVELTRLRRRSSTTLESDSTSAPYSESSRLPVMATNICFDMSGTSPSSSDPDSPVAGKGYPLRFPVGKDESQQHCSRTVDSIEQPLSEHYISLTDSPRSQRSISPLKENRRLQRSEPATTFKQRKLAKSSEDSKSNRSAACQKGNSIAAKRRWS